MPLRLARWTFLVAALYGLAATLSLYAGEPLTAGSQWRYAFAGAGAATQLAYLLVAYDPPRYRMIIPVGIASKLSFAIPVTILYARGAAPVATLAAGLVDFALAVLFAVNFVRLGAGRRSG